MRRPLQKAQAERMSRTMSEQVHLKVLGEHGRQVATECIECERLADGLYRVLRSPAMAQGLARGDTIEVIAGSTDEFRVVERGGMLAIQVFFTGHQPQLQRAIGRIARTLNGVMDSWDYRTMPSGPAGVGVVSVPSSGGFGRIERAFDSVVARFANTEWYFGNVYDPVDGVTPLNWWTR